MADNDLRRTDKIARNGYGTKATGETRFHELYARSLLLFVPDLARPWISTGAPREDGRGDAGEDWASREFARYLHGFLTNRWSRTPTICRIG